MAHSRIAALINRKVRIKSWKGDYLLRQNSSQGVYTGPAGFGDEWLVEAGPGEMVMLKSAKGDYLHRPDLTQGVTTWDTGVGNEWLAEVGASGEVTLKSWKGDYLHRPDSGPCATSWHTGIGNEWSLEPVDAFKRNFAIYPGIGVARMGNSTDFFIGPETPWVNAHWDDATQSFRSFRDRQGRILRQGARFRVFEYDVVDSRFVNFREVLPGTGVADIEWRVHLANRKASFYVFDGQNGAEDNYLTRSQLPGDLQIKEDPDRTNLRNADVPASERASRLDIDPGEKLILASGRGTVELTHENTQIPIQSLGTLKLDEQGRLIVLGGYGQSATTAKNPDGSPSKPIAEYASNDTWFDDAGDGSVKARVRLADGTCVDATPAWVMVGPPDFAPGIGNVVSLYDTLWDIAVRRVAFNPTVSAGSPTMVRIREQRAAWGSLDWSVAPGSKMASYKPSFLHDIYPLIKRALGARDVHVSGVSNAKYHKTMMDWAKLSALQGDLAKEGKMLRGYIFDLMRNPDVAEIEWKKMPRGLGDDYTTFDTEAGPNGKSLFSLTRVQYWCLHQWAADNFIDDWPGAEPAPKSTLAPTPDELDQAAAENSVGGPFFPGIDVSWLIRCPELYSAVFPMRFDYPANPEYEQTSPPKKVGALEFRPGFFSQQMALPWQADFYDCHKERQEDFDGNEYYFMWWAAHRPDDVYPSGGSSQVRWVRLFDKLSLEKFPDQEPDDYYNHDRFAQMEQGWSKLKFVSVKRGDHWEEEA